MTLYCKQNGMTFEGKPGDNCPCHGWLGLTRPAEVELAPESLVAPATPPVLPDEGGRGRGRGR